MRLTAILIDVDSLKQELLKSDAVDILKGVPEGVLQFFCDLLLGRIPCSGLDVVPSAHFSPAGASDDSVICKLVWEARQVASALRAFKLYRNRFEIHGKLSFQMADDLTGLDHGTARDA
jgi:hypothetical protein